MMAGGKGGRSLTRQRVRGWWSVHKGDATQLVGTGNSPSCSRNRRCPAVPTTHSARVVMAPGARGGGERGGRGSMPRSRGAGVRTCAVGRGTCGFWWQPHAHVRRGTPHPPRTVIRTGRRTADGGSHGASTATAGGGRQKASGVTRRPPPPPVCVALAALASTTRRRQRRRQGTRQRLAPSAGAPVGRVGQTVLGCCKDAAPAAQPHQPPAVGTRTCTRPPPPPAAIGAARPTLVVKKGRSLTAAGQRGGKTTPGRGRARRRTLPPAHSRIEQEGGGGGGGNMRVGGGWGGGRQSVCPAGVGAAAAGE